MTRILSVDHTVVGGGISGLTTAYRLHRAQHSFALFEATAHLGGVIRSHWVSHGGARYQVELGPHSLLINNQELVDLIGELNLREAVEAASPKSQNRYVVKHGRLLSLPKTPVEFILTPLWSPAAKLKLLTGLLKPLRRSPTATISDVVRSHFHEEILEYAVAPFVSGIWAGDSDRLEFDTAFSKVARGLKNGDSPLYSLIKQRRSRPRVRRQLISFREGLGTLVERLVEQFESRIKREAKATELRKSPRGFELFIEAREERYLVESRSLTLSVPAPEAAEIVALADPHLAALLRSVVYVPLVVVDLAFPRSACPAIAQEGFGFLLAPNEPREILGAIYTSSLFPGRAPADTMLYSVFLGGRMNGDVQQRSEEELISAATRDLKGLLSISSEPIFRHLHRWKRAIPQFEVGYGELRKEILSRARALGIELRASYTSGISVSDCIAGALQAVESS